MSQFRRLRHGVAVVIMAGIAALASGCAFRGDLVAHDLPPERAAYTLEVETDGVTTVWKYTTQRPQESKTLQRCLAAALGNPDAPPCAPEPLIFLRYQLGLDLDDTVPARQPHQISVTGYYQPQPGVVPTVSSMTVQASFDGGTTWKPMETRAAEGANTFTATIAHPADATGGVALRVSASDSGGNSVVQTIPTAYRLK
ncbi:MAG TPA: hypothetical protein VFY84_17935 [Jiangellales bacterium]|nr:hypothetical protein [Jiangellales bacterium]